MQSIGFIGLGIMGRPMAANLIAAGYEVFLTTRREVPPDLISAGGKPCGNAREVAEKADIIITMVPDTPQVEEVLFGPGGVAEGLAGASRRKVVVDMSSISPIATKDFARRINEIGADYLDAPVSGGEVGAKAASLTIMVGGSQEVFDAVKPVFEKLGKNITLVGANGDGQTTKVANQIIVALNIEAVAEALVFAAKMGADPARGPPGADGRVCVLENPGSPWRAHDQANLRSRIPDRAAPEGSEPRLAERQERRGLAAEHRHRAGIVQRLRSTWRQGVGPFRHGRGFGVDGQFRSGAEGVEPFPPCGGRWRRSRRMRGDRAERAGFMEHNEPCGSP